MEEKERDVLRRNRIYISENIEAEEVVQVLFSKHILFEEDKQKILAKTTTKSRVYKLLDILPRRGPKAFACFVEALGACCNRRLARDLQSQLTGKH